MPLPAASLPGHAGGWSRNRELGTRNRFWLRLCRLRKLGARVIVGFLFFTLEDETGLAGTPSVLFDAVAVILSDEGAKALSKESAAIGFVRDAFGHLKGIAADKGGQVLLKAASVGKDAGVVDASDKDAFITAAKTRQWDRENWSAHWPKRWFRKVYWPGHLVLFRIPIC